MATRVDFATTFEKEVTRLSRTYRVVEDQVEGLLDQLEQDERPGDKIPNVGYDVYKVRLKNPSAGRGKSGGFRVIYYVRLADVVVLLTIYAKTQQENISIAKIRQVIKGYLDAEE